MLGTMMSMPEKFAAIQQKVGKHLKPISAIAFCCICLLKRVILSIVDIHSSHFIQGASMTAILRSAKSGQEIRRLHRRQRNIV